MGEDREVHDQGDMFTIRWARRPTGCVEARRLQQVGCGCGLGGAAAEVRGGGRRGGPRLKSGAEWGRRSRNEAASLPCEHGIHATDACFSFA